MSYGQQPPQYMPPQHQHGPPQHHHAHAQPVVFVQGAAPAMACPAGGSHFVNGNFTCCGITLAIIFFPIGILCCLAMREQRCGKCGQSFGDGC